MLVLKWYKNSKMCDAKKYLDNCVQVDSRFWEEMCVGQCINKLVECACLVSSVSSVNTLYRETIVSRIPLYVIWYK